MVDGYYDELKHFLDCMMNDKTPIETFEDGVIVNSILDAAYRSVQTKKWEPIDLKGVE